MSIAFSISRLVCLEQDKSRTRNYGDEPYEERIFDIIKKRGRGDDAPIDPDEAEAFFLASTPLIINWATTPRPFLRQPVSLEANGRFAMIGTCRYAPPSATSSDSGSGSGSGTGADTGAEQSDSDGGGVEGVGESSLGPASFDVSTETVHITQALATRKSYVPSGATAADYKGAIGVDGQGNVNGCDIFSAKVSWTETVRLPMQVVTHDFVQQLREIVAHWNNAPFRGRDVGEVLLMAASGQFDPDKYIWTINYTFLESKNVTGIKVGAITVAEKYGFDFLDIKYEIKPDTASKRKVVVPIQADVQQVLEGANFGLLGIGF